jgi:hypothetical protein
MMAKFEQRALNDCELDRDLPGAVHHQPTKVRPYATLSPEQVLKARKILRNAHGRLPKETSDEHSTDAT